MINRYGETPPIRENALPDRGLDRGPTVLLFGILLVCTLRDSPYRVLNIPQQACVTTPRSYPQPPPSILFLGIKLELSLESSLSFLCIYLLCVSSRLRPSFWTLIRLKSILPPTAPKRIDFINFCEGPPDSQGRLPIEEMRSARTTVFL